MFDAQKLILVLALAGASVTQAQEPPLQDPMRPHVVVRSAGAGPRADDGLRLTGVLVSESRRIAVINGQFYRVGDFVNGDEILRIEPGSIQIRRGSEQLLVTLKDERAIAPDTDGDQDQ